MATLSITDRGVASLIYITSHEAYYTPDAGIACQSGGRVEISKSRMIEWNVGVNTHN